MGHWYELFWLLGGSEALRNYANYLSYNYFGKLGGHNEVDGTSLAIKPLKL
jgi:hypothetical protein